MSVNDGVMVNRVGLSRKHIFDAVDASIARLGTYLDVLQIHRIDPDVPMEETMKALNDVVDSGKARYIGASSVNPILQPLYQYFTDFYQRWRHGNFKPCRMSQSKTAGISSSVCKITTACSTVRAIGK